MFDIHPGNPSLLQHITICIFKFMLEYNAYVDRSVLVCEKVKASLGFHLNFVIYVLKCLVVCLLVKVVDLILRKPQPFLYYNYDAILFNLSSTL